jgi:DNA repair exonuclease SbcCD ATPase subunit
MGLRVTKCTLCGETHDDPFHHVISAELVSLETPDKIDAIVDAVIERGSPTLDRIIAERDELRADLQGLMDESAASTEAMDRARKEIDSLRAYNEMLLKVEREHVAEVERLQREIRLLARMYALSEEKLRERTERSNDAESQVTTLEWQLSEANKEIERLRAALEEIKDAYRKIGEAPNSDIRALARAHLFKDEPGYASYAIAYVEKLRAQMEWWKSAHDTCCAGGQKLLDEIERLNQANTMLAEEREAWKARALGLPQTPCRHADHSQQGTAIQIEDDCDADD